MRVPISRFLPALIFGLSLAGMVAEAGPAAAASEGLLYSFTGKADGSGPSGGLVADASGALYGVATTGGAAQLGVVFKLTPPGPGQKNWTETVLHSFQGLDAGDGDEPDTGLLMDLTGALYGTTVTGGVANHGTVFRLTPPAGGVGPWTETVLYSFCADFHGCPDGQQPVGLTLGGNGELYGVTEFGGPLHGGAVFKLTPPPAGRNQWTETVLVGLPRVSQAKAGLALDPSGALFGTTSLGGAYNHGVVFKVTPPAAGRTRWTSTTLWSFGGTPLDGRLPLSTVVQGTDGALYGTTGLGGGPASAGVVYRLSPPSAGQTGWHETILHRFRGGDGAQPFAVPTLDPSGALYGTAADGGAGLGSVYKLSPVNNSGSVWPAQVLHKFRARNDAASPTDALLPVASGGFVSTGQGGKFGQGAIYEVFP